MKRRGVLKQARDSFTLIELLIVVSIIAIISVFIFVSVRTSQSRSRDSQRASDLSVLNAAIQMYYRETGHFPELPNGCGTQRADYGWIDGASTAEVDNFISSNSDCYTGEDRDFMIGLTPSYIASLPSDPGPKLEVFNRNNRGYIYYRYLTGTASNYRECYKILLMFPENGNSLQYQNIWDPSLDQGSNLNEVDGTNIAGWSYYSQGCASKNPVY